MQNAQDWRAEQQWRYDRLRQAMAKAGLEGILAYAPGWRRENVRYLTGAATRGSFTLVYLPAVGAPCAFAVSAEDMASIRSAGWVDDVRPLAVPGCAELVSRLRAGGVPGKVGFALLELCPRAVVEALRSSLPGTEWVSATRLMDMVRLVKSSWELQQIRRGAAIADAGWAAFVQAMRPGVTEYEIIAAVEATLKGLGAEDNFMIIASGKTEVMGMSPPGPRQLQVGDLVRTEVTPAVNGYYAQICRSAVLGEPDEGQRRSFDLFREALEAGLAVTRAGVTAHEIAMAENDVFRKYGYGEYCSDQYTRVRGHGHGLHLDEIPAIMEGIEVVLEEHSVIVVHPNTYTPLAGYQVLGDAVVVTRTGYELLLKTERRLFTA